LDGKNERLTSVKKTWINSSTLSMTTSTLGEASVGIDMIGGGAEYCVTYGGGEGWGELARINVEASEEDI
jgi:hypothetical protein